MSAKKKNHISPNIRMEGAIAFLRPFTENDNARMIEIMTDPKTMAHLKYMSSWTTQTMQARMEKWTSEQKNQKGVHFIICPVDSEEVAGTCGYKNIDLVKGTAEFGIILHHPYWGKGLSSDAHLLCLAYAFEYLGLNHVDFITADSNERMRKFFARNGVEISSTPVPEQNEDPGQKYVRYQVEKHFWPAVKQRLEKETASFEEDLNDDFLDTPQAKESKDDELARLMREQGDDQ